MRARCRSPWKNALQLCLRSVAMTAKSLVRFTLLGVGLLSVSTLARAQETAKPDADNKGQIAISHVFRSADLIGLDVRNKKGDEIASINDLVVDMKSGEVRYAAL